MDNCVNIIMPHFRTLSSPDIAEILTIIELFCDFVSALAAGGKEIDGIIDLTGPGAG